MPFKEEYLHDPKFWARFWSKIEIGTEQMCWLWKAAKNDDGYGSYESTTASKIMLQMYLGRLLVGDEQALHQCDNPGCVNPRHIFLGTHQKNMEDMAKKGRRKGLTAGEKNGRAVLTEETVRTIKKMVKKGLDRYWIADVCGTTRGRVDTIAAGHTWAHVTVD